mmetsp:Transcript_4977/g.13925  ORF Transcript_4977/g.13925 Transcript_4977/m.13925 type:complete len:258 (-) Transcript_4977:163-936(-)
MITISGEDIYVAQSRPGSDQVTFLHVVPPSERRRTMRRKLLQGSDTGDDNGYDATATKDCGSGACGSAEQCHETAFYDSSTGTCMCDDGMEPVTDDIQEGGCKCMADNNYAAFNIFTGKYTWCMPCGAGSFVSESGTSCECAVSVWQPGSNTCNNCPPTRVLVMKPWGWDCECPSCEIGVMWGGTVIACVPCAPGFLVMTDSSSTQRCVSENWLSSSRFRNWEVVDCGSDETPTPDPVLPLDPEEPTDTPVPTPTSL